MLTYTDFLNCINDALCAFAPESEFVVYGTTRKNPRFPVITEYCVIADSRPLNLSFRFVHTINRSEVSEEQGWRTVTKLFLTSLLDAACAGKLTKKQDIIY